MSNETEEDLDREMRELMEKEADEKAAAPATPEPQPTEQPAEAPKPVAQAPEVAPVPEAPAPAPAQQPKADDPLEWAKNKGLNTPEALARSLQSMEEEFHRRNQQKHPGYQDLPNGNPAPLPPPPPQSWNPGPDMGGYRQPSFAPPPPTRVQIAQDLAREHGLDPEDVERLAPLMLKLADVVASRRTSALERQLHDVTRQSSRNAEFQTLMQDPAFSDPRVAKEMQEVLKDGSLFQRGGRVYEAAFNIALQNVARKSLQQGSIQEARPPMPPVTAGGGNGSANTSPLKVTPEIFNSWSDKQQDAYMQSNGRAVPRI